MEGLSLQRRLRRDDEQHQCPDLFRHERLWNRHQRQRADDGDIHSVQRVLLHGRNRGDVRRSCVEPGKTNGTFPDTIDAAGDVAGMGKLSTNANVPFLRSNGTMYNLGLPTVFPIPGSTYTSATVSGLNPSGGYAGGAAYISVPLIPVALDATVWQSSITGGVMSSVGTDIVQYLPGWLSKPAELPFQQFPRFVSK